MIVIGIDAILSRKESILKFGNDIYVTLELDSLDSFLEFMDFEKTSPEGGRGHSNNVNVDFEPTNALVNWKFDTSGSVPFEILSELSRKFKAYVCLVYFSDDLKRSGHVTYENGKEVERTDYSGKSSLDFICSEYDEQMMTKHGYRKVEKEWIR